MCACVHASVHLCVSDRSLDSPVFVVFVVLRAPGGCAHFKGPSELWGLETWDCAAQLAPGHGFTRRMWAEQGNWAETGSHKPPHHSSRQQSHLKDSALACQRETLPFCGCLFGIWCTSKSTIFVTIAVFLSWFLHILSAYLVKKSSTLCQPECWWRFFQFSLEVLSYSKPDMLFDIWSLNEVTFYIFLIVKNISLKLCIFVKAWYSLFLYAIDLHCSLW